MQENAPLLGRRDAASFLTSLGYPVSFSALTTWGSKPGGPPFQRFCGRALYTKEELVTWAESRLSPPFRVAASERRAA